MKYGLFLLITSGLFLFSCSQADQNADAVNANDNPIVGKWKLESLQDKKDSGEKISFDSQPSQVILSILDGGYFVLYDTFTDPRFSQKGFSRISEISKGQWEYDDEKLILHHNGDDTTLIEELTITTLNKNTLVTKGKNKKSTIYKTYQGY